MDGATLGWIGGILGGLIGLLGGIVGTYFPIKNAKPGPQRRFVIKGAMVLWTVMAVFVMVISIALLGMIPIWTIWVAQGLFFVGLGSAILWFNRRYRDIS